MRPLPSLSPACCIADRPRPPSPRNPGTIHGSAAPTLETHPLDPYAVDQWNLNNLSILPDSLLRYVKTQISGCTVPWIYVGHLCAPSPPPGVPWLCWPAH